MKKLRKQIDELLADKLAMENQIAVDDAVSDIKRRLPKFQPNKVKDYLTQLNKTNSELANSLNNPYGWEKVWINEIEKKVA